MAARQVPVPPGKFAVFLTPVEGEILRDLILDRRELTDDDEAVLDGISNHVWMRNRDYKETQKRRRGKAK